MDNPQDHLSRLMGISFSRWSSIMNLKNIAEIGLESGRSEIDKKVKNFLDIFLSQEIKSYMKEEGVNPEEFEKGLPNKLVKQNIKNFQTLIEATSLIFAQSILDFTTFEYCKITRYFNKDYWLKKIVNQKISIKEVLEKNKDEILEEKLNDYFHSFERESLIKKIDQIFASCSPPSEFTPFEDLDYEYEYDRDRISKIDKKRHDIIHSNKTLDEIGIKEEDIYYLQFTDMYLSALVKQNYDLEIDKYKMFN